MRIALVGNDSLQQFPLESYGGIETCVENLAIGLNDLGRDFFVVAPKRSTKLDYQFNIYETEGYPTTISNKNSHSYAYDVGKVLDNLKFDIIWSQSNWSIEPLLRFNKPIICSFHDSCEKVYGWMKKYKNVKYRFISKFQYDLWVKEDWEKQDSFWCYTGLTKDNFICETRKDNYFLWCAGLNWGIEAKGLDYFINVAKNNKDYEFISYGSANTDLEKYLYTLDKQIKNFHFKGALKKGDEHSNVFRKAKGFFMPTRLPEAFGRTIIESFSKGTPVFGSKNGALQELIEDGVNGFKLDLNDTNINLNHNFDYNLIYDKSKRFSIENEIKILEEESFKLV